MARFLGLLLALSFCAAARGGDLTIDQVLAGGKLLDHYPVIIETAGPHDADMCRGFDLTASQVREFFRKARVTDPAVLQNGFEHAPCEVEGHLRYGDQRFTFIVNAAATGEIEIAPGRYLKVGCAEVCKSIFDYGYPTPPAVTASAAATSAPSQ